MITDETGEIVARYEYGAYGNKLSGSVDGIGLSYTWGGSLGLRFDALSNLFYVRNRWYDSNQCRFISRDPLGWGAGENSYLYVDGNPIGAVDPSGLEKEDGIVGWIVEVITRKKVMKVEPVGTFEELVEMIRRGNDVICDCKDTAKNAKEGFPAMNEVGRQQPRQHHDAARQQTRQTPGVGRPTFKPKGHYHVQVAPGQTPHIFYSSMGGGASLSHAASSTLRGLGGKLRALGLGMCAFANRLSVAGDLYDVFLVINGETVYTVDAISSPNLGPGYGIGVTPFGWYQWFNYWPGSVPDNVT